MVGSALRRIRCGGLRLGECCETGCWWWEECSSIHRRCWHEEELTTAGGRERSEPREVHTAGYAGAGKAVGQW